MKKPRLGQNYLTDDNIAHKIVHHAGISNDQHVLEITTESFYNNFHPFHNQHVACCTKLQIWHGYGISTGATSRIAEFSGIPSTQATKTFQNVSKQAKTLEICENPSTENLGS